MERTSGGLALYGEDSEESVTERGWEAGVGWGMGQKRQRKGGGMHQGLKWGDRGGECV